MNLSKLGKINRHVEVPYRSLDKTFWFREMYTNNVINPLSGAARTVMDKLGVDVYYSAFEPAKPLCDRLNITHMSISRFLSGVTWFHRNWKEIIS